VDAEGLFLKDIFNVLGSTLLSLFEWAGSTDFGWIYNDEGCKYVCADVPINGQGEKASLDRRSHRVHTKDGPHYGAVHVLSTNGIWNNAHDAHDGLDYLAEMAPGCSVSGVYNATHGIWDVVESFLNLLFGVSTRPAALLHKEWDDYFNNCPDDGIIIHYCHSQGAILTRNALKSYDPELRKRIHVIAVAPGAYIDKELCGSVVHFVSRWDFVPWLDPIGRWRNQDTIQVLDRHPKASYFDHASNSPTFHDEVSKRIVYVRRHFGDMRI
jgi:hypothetical protein